jgi:hypothetical protein
MRSGGEAGHVEPELGDDDVRGGRSDSGDLIEAPDRRGERGDQLFDPGLDRGDVGAGLIDTARNGPPSRGDLGLATRLVLS